MSQLKTIFLNNIKTKKGLFLGELPISYKVFGQDLGNAPVVLVFHALTGNSTVCGKNGWWQSLISDGGCIDLKVFTVIAFDIPGNGSNPFFIDVYKKVEVDDVAEWFAQGLMQLGITKVFAGIGGSLGGRILWQMALNHPRLFQNIIPIATHYQTTDWITAQCNIQDQILNNSVNPVHDARLHAMTLYRTPQSFKKKFRNEYDGEKNLPLVISWLFYHGKKLQERFSLSAYKLMNHLLASGEVVNKEEFRQKALQISANIYLIGIDSDLFYLAEDIKETFFLLKQEKEHVHYYEINSLHGHDAFLIEYEQLAEIINPIFQTTIKNTDKYELTSIG